MLVRDALDNYLLINVLLTLLGWLPGVIHALWVLLRRNPSACESPARAGGRARACVLAAPSS